MIDNRLIAEFKRPKAVEFKRESQKKNEGVFTAMPYERGFAVTVGNSIRRTLLSSVPGYAIIAFKADKINNEFQNIPGVYQDTSELLVNLKNVHIALNDPQMKSRVLHFDIKGSKNFLAKDLAVDANIVIGNPDFLIFSTNKSANFSFEVQVDYGRGYVPSEAFEDMIEIAGTIPIDGNYSPVLNVSFKVDELRASQRKYYEKLTISVNTKGILAPEDALKTASQILKECYYTFNNMDTEILTTEVDSQGDQEEDKEGEIFSKSVYTIPLSVRTHFFLKINEIRKIGQLVTKTEEDIRSKSKFTEFILDDIKEALETKELHLGMTNIPYVSPVVA